MRKNKLYVPLALLIAIILFATAALCNQCASGNGEKIGTDGEESESSQEAEEIEEAETEETSEEEESTEEEEEEESTEEEEEEEQTQSADEEPTIELEIYEEPLYSSADDVCYWRIKAVVTGVPTPVVEFSRDDSNGAWGSRKAQINLADPTDSYTLSATATNSEGVDSDSIVLTWECNRDPEISDIIMMGDHFAGIEYTISAAAVDPDGDTLSYLWSVNGGSLDISSGDTVKWTMPDIEGDYQITVEVNDGNGGTDSRTETVEVMGLLGPPIAAMELPIVSTEGGYISQSGGVCSVCTYHLVGDQHTNEPVKGFISFDITGLSGAIVEDATLTFGISFISNDPSNFVPLWLSSVNWEPGVKYIIPTDYNLQPDLIQNFSTSSFACDSPKLKQYLENAISDGRDRFQIMIFFTGAATDNDNLGDYWCYNDSDISLYITYTP